VNETNDVVAQANGAPGTQNSIPMKKPRDPSIPPPFLAKITKLALATSTAFLGLATPTHADLVGRWFTGAASLADTSGSHAAGTHDGIAIGSNAGLLSYTSDVPSGFTGQSLDLRVGNVGVMVANSASTDAGYLNTFDAGTSSQMTISFWAKGFPTNWAPWISKRGEDGIGWQMRRFSDSNVSCFTMRGVDNEDAPGSPINVNQTPAKWHHYAGVWDQSNGSRTLYVDGVLSHVVYNNPSQNTALATAKHLAFGARQTSGSTFDSYYQGQLFDVRIYNEVLSPESVLDMIPPATPQNLVATPGNLKVALNWTPTYGALSYTVTTRNGTTNAVQTNVIPADFTGLPPSSFIKTGLTNGVNYFFKITSTNGSGTSAATAEISAIPNIGTAKDILTFNFDGLGDATISGNNIIKNVPVGTDVTFLSPTYTTSALSSEDANFPSGTTRDFTTPQTYTITAENGSTKTYTVTVAPTSPVTYDFNTSLQGWTQIWPTVSTGFIWKSNRLDAGGDNDDTRFGRSPAFYLNNLGPLTFTLFGGGSAQTAPAYGPSAIPQLSAEGGFAGAALRDVLTNTYVLSKNRDGNSGDGQNVSFTAAQLAPFANNGRQYTLDFIDYNKGGWGWTNMDDVSIPGTLVPAADMVSMTLNGAAAISGNNVTLTLPFGSSVTALAPTYTLSAGATCNKVSGSTQNFSSPVTYTVTSSDTLLTHTYTVTAVVLPNPTTALVGHWISGPANLTENSGFTAAGTHDGVAVGSNAGALAFNPNDVPRDFSGSSLDLRAGNVAVNINNTALTDSNYQNTFDDVIRNQFTVAFWAKGLPVSEWGIWVSKRGEEPVGWSLRRFTTNNVGTFTMRGVDNADAPGSLLTIPNNPPVWQHFAGVWDQALGVRSLYVDGVLSHDTNNAVGQIMGLANAFHLTIGAGETGPGTFDRFSSCQLYDLRIYKQKLFAAQIQTVMTTPTTAQPVEAKLRNFGLPNLPSVISGTNVTWAFPIGSDLTALAPTFTLTAGATCSPVSGTTRNFNTPQTYTVTGSDSTVNVYTVNVVLGNSFATDNILDGWHNRVWDATASAWVDLAPDISDMPATINGGVIQPPGASSLFRNGYGAVEANGDRDNHLNTLWLRSPQFNVGASGDLTLKLSKGLAHTAAPANEAAVPFASVQDGGWMGVILRRVSDGAFVLTKSKSIGNSDTFYPITFTQAELAPFVGVTCTIELINSDKGGWGWLSLDDVVLPGGSTTPTAPTGSPFATWINTNYPTLSDKTPGGDPDKDGMTNQQEYAFGLDPSSGSSVSPITMQLNKAAGTFRYTRRNPAVSGLAFTVMTSTNLVGWTPDAGATASQTVVSTAGDVQTVAVTLSGVPLTSAAMFVRVKAE
jgi:hypothetical protein